MNLLRKSRPYLYFISAVILCYSTMALIEYAALSYWGLLAVTVITAMFLLICRLYYLLDKLRTEVREDAHCLISDLSKASIWQAAFNEELRQKWGAQVLFNKQIIEALGWEVKEEEERTIQ